MSYSFERPVRLAVEIRRVLVERLDDALLQLGDETLLDDRAVAVHTARKDIKKARSLLRLAKGSLDPEAYRSQNDRLRLAAHELAAIREADAMVASLSKLVERRSGEMSEACSQATRDWLASRQSSGVDPKDVAAPAARAGGLLRQVRADAQILSLGYGSWETIEPGLRRGYRLGREGLEAAAASPDDDTLHEWRKRVKDMWYSLRLLHDAWPPVLEVLGDEAHRLSEILGDHHDLGEAASAIEADESGLDDECKAELSDHVFACQAELHSDAILIGRRLYAESPSRYSYRLEALWHAWERSP